MFMMSCEGWLRAKNVLQEKKVTKFTPKSQCDLPLLLRNDYYLNLIFRCRLWV